MTDAVAIKWRMYVPVHFIGGPETLAETHIEAPTGGHDHHTERALDDLG
ncbi:hypothetical protein G3T14_20770 [Methylobacterium sp. BTF04]|nr:hypothetical protein [Methylobacterium sp. BTF04]NEU14532.1 hypothetical protein [Methylobacterium sp. BTF04]